MLEVYGMTETWVTRTILGEAVQKDWVCRAPNPGVEVKLSEQNEILVRAPAPWWAITKKQENCEALDRERISSHRRRRRHR